MAASCLCARGHAVTLYERRPGLGRKLLIAGSSGLNITHEMPLEEFARQYSGSFGPDRMRPALEAFGPRDWIRFIEGLGIGTFKGTSRRYFVQGMKAAELLKAWTETLCAKIVTPSLLRFDGDLFRQFDATCLALGGGSYEETPPAWPDDFRALGIRVEPFAPSNSGYGVAWPAGFLAECEGRPLKNVALTTARGSRRGELMITRYGIEGTPVYAIGTTGPVRVDLKPDLELAEIERRMAASKENLSPLRRIKRFVKPSDEALALLFHGAPPEAQANGSRLARLLKAFPLDLLGPRPLAEAISSSGGVHADEIDERLMLRKLPGVFVAGEMIDWDAPTGGFLIQGCVSTGALAAAGIDGLNS
jgi:uncharacterized flavoprotein (TIGR03862 family)